MATTHIGAAPGEAGVAVEFSEPTAPGTPSPYGSSLFLGGYQWGAIRTVVAHTGETHFGAYRGSPMTEDHTALNCYHWYEQARGAGKLYTYRLADGDEAQASIPVYGRDQDRNYTYQTGYSQPTKVADIEGLYDGRRGGKIAHKSGYLAAIAAAFDAAAGTFATAETMVSDQFKDGLLYIDGVSLTYRITGNTTGGLLSIEVSTGDAGPAAGGGYWFIDLNTTDANGDRDGLAVQIDGSVQRPTEEFSLQTYDHRGSAEVKPSWDTLGLDSSRDSYAESIIVADGRAGRQHLLSFDAETLPNPNSSEMRPANRSYLVDPDSAVTNVLTLKTQYWARSAPVSVGTATPDEAQTVYPANRFRCKAVCTFTAPITADVEFRLWDDTVIGDTWTVAAGEGVTLGTLFVPGTAFLPSFMIYAGATPMASTDTVTIWFDPLPVNIQLLNGRLYPHAHTASGTDIRTSLPIVSNTATTVTVASTVTLGSTYTVTAPVQVFHAGVTAGTFNLAGAETFIYTLHDDAGPITLTNSLVGAAITAAALVVELNTGAAANSETGQRDAINQPPRIEFAVNAAGSITVTQLKDIGTVGGTAASMTIGAGTLNAIVGWTAAAYTNSVVGSVVAISYRENLNGGQDGVATLANSHYTDAFDVVSSPVLGLQQVNTGLVKMATPGMSVATVQNAAHTFADTVGYAYRGELSTTNATSDETAANWVIDNLTASRNRSIAFDAYGYPHQKPFTGQETVYPMTGAILGMEARLAREKKGYHIPAAGKKSSIGGTFSGTSVGLQADNPAHPRDTILFPVGLQGVRKEGALLYLWGDQNPNDNYFGAVWKHKVECLLHIGQELLHAVPESVWEANDVASRISLVRQIRPIFTAKWADGWFAHAEGEDFDDVIFFKAGDDENPPAVAAAGDMVCVIELVKGIVDTAQRVVFAVGTGGVAVNY